MLGDPRRFHPVAGFGQAAGALERRLYAPNRRAGAAFTAVAVGVPVAAGLAAAVLTRRQSGGPGRAGRGRDLDRAGRPHAAPGGAVMAGHLERGDLAAARGRLSHLCGRDPSALDEPELARATVESVAENTSDAVVAPLFWGAVAGLPGLLGYRAANTLDAMVGHRSPRYARFGTPAARLDDLLNLVPSRLTGLLTIAAAPIGRRAAGRGAAGVAARPQRSPESRTPGSASRRWPGRWACASAAATSTSGAAETRPFLGDGPRPSAGAPAPGRPALRRGRRVARRACVARRRRAGRGSRPAARRGRRCGR